VTVLAKSHVEVTMFQRLKAETLLLGQSIDNMKISLSQLPIYNSLILTSYLTIT